jgi:hypothetical protein
VAGSSNLLNLKKIKQILAKPYETRFGILSRHSPPSITRTGIHGFIEEPEIDSKASMAYTSNVYITKEIR